MTVHVLVIFTHFNVHNLELLSLLIRLSYESINILNVLLKILTFNFEFIYQNVGHNLCPRLLDIDI